MYQYGPHLGRGKKTISNQRKHKENFLPLEPEYSENSMKKKKQKKENKRKERQRNRQNLLLPTGAVLFGIFFIPFAIVIILRIANN